MIGEEWQLWVIGGIIPPGGPGCWQVVDWDQRRTISVTFENDPGDEDLAIEYLRRYFDNLGTDVYAIEVSNDGELVSVSSDPDDDKTLCPHFPPLRDLQLDRVETVLRSELRELDRLGPNVDLVSYQNRKAVFKYYFHLQFVDRRWDEMNLWIRLSAHPNIVPFDRVVVEQLDGSQDHIVGFTSLHIAGGTLDAIEENPGDCRVFKLKWLLQLMSLVDDLNYKYGIQHQDIAPRNLVVDEATDNIMLFDFNFSARIGAPARGMGMGIGFFEDRDDIKGVIFTLYEIITRDDHFRSVPHRDQDASGVLNMENWVKHSDTRLDEPVATYRAELNAWVLRRKERGNLKIFTDASDYVDWPDLPEPIRRMPYQDDGADSELEPETYPSWAINRQNAKDKNIEVIEWQRPAQKMIKEGMWVYADGRVVDASNQA
ncbi:hypothetical protein diail_7752 [Diaporthe ilicicola]|nr:hypothetical protein diail_7752 [Diaporthe ilicicola]